MTKRGNDSLYSITRPDAKRPGFFMRVFRVVALKVFELYLAFGYFLKIRPDIGEVA